MATTAIPRPGFGVPRRPRELNIMDEEGNVVEQESEEDYNALFGITEENPQGVGIDEYGPDGKGVRSLGLTDASTSGGGYGKKRKGEQSRGQMNLTGSRGSRILTS